MASSEGIGDNSYEGNGTMLCASCGTPLRDHRIAQPCPTLGVTVFYVERPRRNTSDHPDTQRQRAYRAKRKAEKEKK